MRTILALDLGTSSVGWALFSLDDQNEPASLVDLGVRHFEEVTEPKTKELLNAKRRAARQMRKNLRRRRQRRDNLLSALRDGGLVSDSATPYADSGTESRKPYELRAKAAMEPVSLEDLGRALFHLGRRRGFKSNRGAKRATLDRDPEVQALHFAEAEDSDQLQTEEAKEEGLLLQAISGLREEMGTLTLGQYFLARLLAGERVRGRHADRAMYEDEFERIWNVQSRHHPEVLTKVFKARVYHAIFHQRPLKAQKYLKSNCSMEPTKVRAERAQLISQRFRYWQDLANLEITDSRTGEKRLLSQEEKELLADRLESQMSMSWTAIRKELGLARSWTFNLERAKNDGLKGNATAARISKRAKDFWSSLDKESRDQLVEILLTIPDRGVLYKALRKKYDLAPQQAYDLATLELEGGTANLSSKAMSKMLRFMQQGQTRIEAQVSAGYEPWNTEVVPQSRLSVPPQPREIPNPRVRKALGQVRKVVNALIAAYGKPTLIRIEMARDLSLTKQEKAGLEKANKALAKENKRAEDWFNTMGVESPSRSDRIWFRLAEQCSWTCPYTGLAIPQVPRSTSRFQIEHIVPYVKSLDDSFNNLTLCESETNQKKGNQTPFEAFGATAEWTHMVDRVSKWRGFGTGHKKRLFSREVMPEEEAMVSRQLNETRWICKAAAEYLKPVCGEVQVTKGQATARIRTHWGLMEALYGINEKSRDDLRHHAVDAVAIAFTSRSLFQKVTSHRKRQSAQGLVDMKVEPLSDSTVPPAPGWLHSELKQRLESVVVSHETTRGILDAFHKETAMGLVSSADGTYRLRKLLTTMTPGELETIIDPTVRRLAVAAHRAAGGDAAKAFSEGLTIGGSVARSARISKQLKKAPMLGVPVHAPTKYFELGNNHHVEIFEHMESGKRVARYVTTLEAARRVRQAGLPLVDAMPPGPDWRFLMWLAPNDTIFVPEPEGQYFRLESLWSTTNQLCFRQIAAATQSDNTQRLLKTVGSLVGNKVEVDPIGRACQLPEGTV